MSSSWTYVHWGCRRRPDGLLALEEENIEEEYRNCKVVQSMCKTKQKIKKLLLANKDVKIEYYTNFVVIEGQTFNGITRECIRKMKEELSMVSKYELARRKMKEEKEKTK